MQTILFLVQFVEARLKHKKIELLLYSGAPRVLAGPWGPRDVIIFKRQKASKTAGGQYSKASFENTSKREPQG